MRLKGEAGDLRKEVGPLHGRLIGGLARRGAFGRYGLGGRVYRMVNGYDGSERAHQNTLRYVGTLMKLPCRVGGGSLRM